MKKSPTKILSVIVIILAIIAFVLVDSFFIVPNRFVTRRETLKSEEIPEQLDDTNILFFSDLDYGAFMDESRLDKLIETINLSGADLVIFGGDIYDNEANITEETNTIISNAFKSINAKYGKFAVYGDRDENSDVVKNAVDTIYNNSDFEVINNTSFNIHKNGSKFITLVGLDNGLNGTNNVDGAYANVSSEAYVITVCHTPDSADLVPTDLTDYFLAGHSHGGQVYYFFSSLYTPANAIKYFRGKNDISNAFTLDITNGVGTTIQDVRFLANAEIVVYTLKSQATKATSTPSSTLEAESTSVPEETVEPTIEPTEEPTEQPTEEPTQEESIDDNTDTSTDEYDDTSEEDTQDYLEDESQDTSEEDYNE